MKRTTILLLSFILFMFQFIPPTLSYAVTNSNLQTIDFLIPKTIELDIGDSIELIRFPCINNLITFKSNKPSIASIDQFGIITAKKAGNAIVTATCLSNNFKFLITVRKTQIDLNNSHVTLEPTKTFQLTAKTSNGSFVTYKSKKKSIATVDDNGFITALKPGETTITVSSDNTNVTCKVIVVAPTITINRSSVNMYRNQVLKLTAKSSNGVSPTWKSNKSSIATISKDGEITAKKHGTALITAMVDGVSVTCTVNVLQPTITLSNTSLTLPVGDQKLLTAKVSSGNKPSYKSSNSKIVTVSQDGQLTAKKSGTAYITVFEDGVKVKCKVAVTSATVTS